MSKTIKDILTVLSGQINSNELSAALSASNPMEVEFDDETFENTSSQIKSLMTLDRAVNNDEVFKALGNKSFKQNKAQIMTQLETKLKERAKEAGLELDGEFDSMIDSVISSTKKTDDGGYKTEYEKLQRSMGELKTTHQSEIDQWKSKFDDFKVDTTLRNKINSIPLSKHYQDERVRKSLIDSVISEVKNKAIVKLDDESGQIKLFNRDNPEIELFADNNKKMEVDDLVNPIMQPYLQVSPDKPEKEAEKVIETSLPNDSTNPRSSGGMLRHSKVRF